MHGLFFYIGLGLGLAAACGLRPYLPTLLAGGLGSAGALGVGFTGHFHFLQAGWWLVVVAVAFVGSYVLQLRLAWERFQLVVQPAIVAQAIAARRAAVRGHARCPRRRLVAGAGRRRRRGRARPARVGPVVAGARSRLPDRAAREALTIYLDAASLLLAALVALLHPLGYVLLALLALLLVRTRRRAGEKYAGLRILRR